jgi:hypothetical protein
VERLNYGGVKPPGILTAGTEKSCLDLARKTAVDTTRLPNRRKSDLSERCFSIIKDFAVSESKAPNLRRFCGSKLALINLKVEYTVTSGFQSIYAKFA